MTGESISQPQESNCQDCPWLMMFGVGSPDTVEASSAAAERLSEVELAPYRLLHDHGWLSADYIRQFIDKGLFDSDTKNFEDIEAQIRARNIVAFSNPLEDTRFDARRAECRGPRAEPHFTVLGVGIGRKVLRCTNPAIPWNDARDNGFIPGRKNSWAYPQ